MLFDDFRSSVVRTRDKRGAYRVWWGNMREGDYLEDLGVDGRVILKWIFKKWNGEARIGLVWLRGDVRVASSGQ
jgi:hypothetical protein